MLLLIHLDHRRLYLYTPFHKRSPSQAIEAVVQRCSVKKVLLKISQNSQENTCARASFLIKLQTETCNFIIIETLPQVFSCEFYEISKKTFSYRTFPVAASAEASDVFPRLDS